MLTIALFLRDHTDAQHSVTVDQIIEACNEQGFSGTRKTITDDLKALKKAGMAYEAENLKVTEKKRYYYSREFQPEELRLLVDIVSSSHSIDESMRSELIDKISRLASMPNRGALTGNWVSEAAAKAATDEIKRTLDRITTAIETDRIITFQYFEYDRNKTRKLRHNGEEYQVSPYDLVYQGDRYYLFGFSARHGKTVSFRVERMTNVRLQDNSRFPDPDYDLDKYMQSTINMFEGGKDAIDVVVKSENCYMDYVVDQFGTTVNSWALTADPDHFYFRVCVKPSTTFFSWLFKFRMQIMKPEAVVEEYKEMLKAALNP